ncbi:MAG TPA: helix-turn-helix transcriptional regulator [Verrucomicrobiae bacterium]|nr:helix-turn-helix transcriptional regulator [Verrucomicrobiae bacterium]
MASPFATAADWMILHASARRHAWKGEGWLSIKSFSGGRAQYSVGSGLHAVGDDSYLILNHGRTYTVEIDATEPVESFCVFFSRDFAADALRTSRKADSELLDLESNCSAPVEFFEKNYRHDQTVTPVLRKLKRTHQHCERTALEEQMHRLIVAIVKAHGESVREADRLPNVRAATRHELYRRAARARDFADALFSEPITLKQIATAAALSPNHLMRVFAQVYRQTPHEFLTARRIAEAKKLLSSTAMSVTEICFAVGFQSLGSFSSLFYRQIGKSPTGFRASNK